MEKKSYNIMGFDDMDYVEELGLDPALAYTPEINEAIAEIVAQKNYQFYIDNGIEEEKAKHYADKLKKKAMDTVDFHTNKKAPN